MTAAGSTAPLPLAIGILRPTVLGNLLRKELRESAGAFVAGLTIYWIMPAVLELLYWAIDPRHEMLPGFAWFFIVFTGWLYAMVIAAYTVCRDWGRAEEHFLLARPVSPRMVICAKLVAGIAVVVSVMLAGTLWDWLLLRLSQKGTGESPSASNELAGIWIVVACALAASFVMAFAVAVMSRQMLPSVLLPSLVLTIWCTAPLISGRLTFLYPPQLLDRNLASTGGSSLPVWLGPLASIGFTAAVGGCIITSLGTAMLTCTRERVIRLGHRPLAWATALTVLLLFAAAMDEVGNSLPVRDQHVFVAPDHLNREVPPRQRTAVASCGDRFVVLFTQYLSQPGEQDVQEGEEKAWRYGRSSCLAEFRVDNEGRIQECREAELGFLGWNEYRSLLSPDEYRKPGPRSTLSEILFWDWLVKIVVVQGSPTHVIIGGATRDAVLRLRLAWPDQSQPEVTSEASVPMATDSNLVGPVQHLMTNRFSYLLYLARPPRQQNEKRSSDYYAAPRMLRVVDWADGSNAQERYAIRLPAGTSISLKQECLVFSCPSNPGNYPNIEDWTITAVPVDNPEVLAELQANPSDLFKPGPNAWWRVVQPFRLGELQRLALASPSAWTLGKNGILYLSDVLGFRVFGPEKLGARPVIGNYWRSPLSMLLTDYWSWPALHDQYSNGSPTQLYGDSLLIEPGLTAYDVSDPARPRRVGYFNAAPDACILATTRHLVLCEGSLVTVLDQPARHASAK